ncbi:peptide MFS transporter [Riemerella anatipestifer]|uniref:Peptide MFS transporter n=1 Tax=Riemerella anatipestifer TaxID=34085 RepID=A0AAP3AJT1_RIEAN|nr:peptide MFS transporter [Riemerella anatipestifer]AZZ59413.1 MFS transporter [Riemerella anatipestifer]MBT0574094.1 peptide MFS transporter [Riemerella anatipestifer]MCO7319266.1 peptide MFS transporter [Riemerella anatipestifer]MCQ4155541.1 peptide MFS transporter [Riemerella anatipestifer]MCQ4181492.1 peptide MFS transporter [Riemerella anatipestifer]
MDTTVSKKGHPAGLYLLFVTEMWERFSYYGMRALFVLFMTKALMFDKGLGAQIYGSYTGLVYLTPLIGGYIADRYWGNRKSIIVGGILMALGQFLMFMSGYLYESKEIAPLFMFSGLGFLIFGNGFFKPNISSMVGQLYSENDSRVDGAFTIFYMGINLGAFIAPLLCGYLGDTGNAADFKWGFLVACIGMILSVIIFVLFKNKYLVTPEGEAIGGKPTVSETSVKDDVAGANLVDNTNATKKAAATKLMIIWGVIWLVLLGAFYFLMSGDDGNKDLIGAFIFSLTLAAPGYIISDPSLTKIEKKRIWVIYIVAFFVIFFWSAFEQAGASLTYFAEEQTDRHLLGKVVPASYFQSINAVAIVVFAPIFAVIWSALSKRKMEPASPYKQAIGLFLLALGYLVIAFGVKGLAPGVKVSMMWLVSLYTIHTFGELCLSPIGLSMVNKLAPVRFVSLLMGVWFLSTATANKFAGTLSSFYPQSYVSVDKVQNFEKEVNTSLINKDFNIKDKKNVVQIDGQNMIPFDKITVADIKNEDLKQNIKLEIEKAQVVKEKSFLGFKVASLYDFFMLFVFMSGISSVILFLLSKYLVKMMHGVK